MSASDTKDLSTPTQDAPPPFLTNSQILKLYIPLGLSWVLMSIEGPVSVALLSGFQNKEVLTAAFSSMMALSFVIESPVIDLLSTSTTLAKSQRSFATLSRFVWYLIAWVTVVHALVSLTPLYWWVARDVMDLKQDVAEAMRPGLIVMIPFSGFIGWRRYLQGLLIRNGQTRVITVGTLVRLISIFLVGVTALNSNQFSGVVVAALAIVVSVILESLFIHFVSRPIVQKYRSGALDQTDNDPPITIRDLTKFHLPLSFTTLVSISFLVLIVQALAKMPPYPDPVLSQSAWQVALTLGYGLRSYIFALPEVVITLGNSPENREKMRRFCMYVGIFSSGSMFLVSLSGADVWFFHSVMNRTLSEAYLAHTALLALSITPLIGTAQCYLRGVLTLFHATKSRMYSIIVGTATLLVCLLIGSRIHYTSVVVVSGAHVISLIAELIVLGVAWKQIGLTQKNSPLPKQEAIS